MARPGEKITRKTIMMQNKMKELDLKERSSKSLLANVLDMDDDFRPSSTLPGMTTDAVYLVEFRQFIISRSDRGCSLSQ